MFKIGEFSKISRVPIKTLRYYDEIGLFSPAQIDRFTGYRFYSAAQLPRLNRILALKEMGLALQEIARLLHEPVSPEELRGMFRLQEAAVRGEVEAAQARLARIANRLHQIEQEGKMPEQDVVIKQIEPQRVLMIRQVIPTPDYVGVLMGESYGAMQQQGLEPVGAPITIFYDDGFPETNMDVATAFPVDGTVKDDVPFSDGRRLTVTTLPTIDAAACIIHQGDYSGLEATYAVLGRWIEEHGYQIVGHPREIYLTAPGDDEGPITEIQFPVTKG